MTWKGPHPRRTRALSFPLSATLTLRHCRARISVPFKYPGFTPASYRPHADSRKLPMLDLKLLQKQPEVVAKALADRHSSISVDEFLELAARRRAALTEVETLKSRRNAESAEVAPGKTPPNSLPNSASFPITSRNWTPKFPTSRKRCISGCSACPTSPMPPCP